MDARSTLLGHVSSEVFHLEATAVDRHWFSLPRRGLKALCGKFSGLRLNCGGPSL